MAPLFSQCRDITQESLSSDFKMIRNNWMNKKKEEKQLVCLESNLEEQTLGKWAESLGDTDTSAKYNKWPLLMAIQHFTSSPSLHFYQAGKPHARPFPIGLVSGDNTQASLSHWSASGALDRQSKEDVFCLPFSG